MLIRKAPEGVGSRGLNTQCGLGCDQRIHPTFGPSSCPCDKAVGQPKEQAGPVTWTFISYFSGDKQVGVFFLPGQLHFLFFIFSSLLLKALQM